jgi:hypothetical protein
MWYSFIGFSITIIVGLIVSFATGKRDPRTLDPQLISPPIDKFVRNYVSQNIRDAILWDLGADKVLHKQSCVCERMLLQFHPRCLSRMFYCYSHP